MHHPLHGFIPARAADAARMRAAPCPASIPGFRRDAVSSQLVQGIRAEAIHSDGMEPLIVLVASFPIFTLAGRLGVRPLRRWQTALRWSLAAMFLLTASAHFVPGLRADLIQMVPPVFPRPDLLVTLTGFAELAGAIGLLVPRFAPWAASGLALLLIAMFPANVHAAREGLQIGGTPVEALLPRTLMQVGFLLLLGLSVLGDRRRSRRDARRHHVPSEAPAHMR